MYYRPARVYLPAGEKRGGWGSALPQPVLCFPFPFLSLFFCLYFSFPLDTNRSRITLPFSPSRSKYFLIVYNFLISPLLQFLFHLLIFLQNAISLLFFCFSHVSFSSLALFTFLLFFYFVLRLAFILPYPSHASFSSPSSGLIPHQNLPRAPTCIPSHAFSHTSLFRVNSPSSGPPPSFTLLSLGLPRAPILCRFPPRFLSPFSSHRLTLTILTCFLSTFFFYPFPSFLLHLLSPRREMRGTQHNTHPRERRLWSLTRLLTK